MICLRVETHSEESQHFLLELGLFQVDFEAIFFESLQYRHESFVVLFWCLAEDQNVIRHIRLTLYVSQKLPHFFGKISEALDMPRWSRLCVVMTVRFGESLLSRALQLISSQTLFSLKLCSRVEFRSTCWSSSFSTAL